MPRRILTITGTVLLLVLGLALYREWVIRNTPALYLPLGFSELATPVSTPEVRAQDPSSWNDPVQPSVVSAADFASAAASAKAIERRVDVLVVGATMGGVSAASAAAGDGLDIMLATPRGLRESLVSEAAEYAMQPRAPASIDSPIEWNMRQWLQRSSAVGPNGLPLEIADFFSAEIADIPRLETVDRMEISMFGRDENGRVARALLIPSDGSSPALSIGFSYLVDATDDGKALALAGAETRSSWGEDDDESIPQTPSAEAYDMLARGYTMSGRTVPGIGKRLEGAESYLGIFDRGYAGWFSPASAYEDCWATDDDPSSDPFVADGTVLRAREQECSATIDVRSSFVDTAELFWINHGNDTVSATVSFGSGGTVNVTKRFNPNDRFVRLGAFPIGPDNPVSVEVHSTLPTDKLEGIIARALNVGYRTASWKPLENGEASIVSNGWNVTEHDVYVTRPEAVNDSMDVSIDGTTWRADAIGENTYLASGVPLVPGRHSVVAEGVGDGSYVTFVPVRPWDERESLSPVEHGQADAGDGSTWSFVAESARPILVSAIPSACPETCEMTFTESGSLDAIQRITMRKGEDGLSAVRPLLVAYPRAGATYVITANGGFDRTNPPTAVPLGSGSILFAAGSGEQTIAPLEAGNTYDIWVRPLRSANATIETPTMRRSNNTIDGWGYVSTELLNASGVRTNASGYVELLAVPNTLVDAYHIPLAEGSPALIDGIPDGAYAMTSFGIGNPGSMTVKTRANGVLTQTFAGGEGMYRSASPLSLSGSTTVSIATPWAQTLVLHETLSERGTQAEQLLFSRKILESADASSNDAGGAHTAKKTATYVLSTRYGGINPVTMGMVGTDELTERMATLMHDAYALVRRGKIIGSDVGCGSRNDPTCDPRRYTLAPWILDAPEAALETPRIPEGRRVAGTETLGYGDSHAVTEKCFYCATQCIDGTSDGTSCVLREKALWNTDAVVSVAGTGAVLSYASPSEERLHTVPSLLQSMRREGLLGKSPTYFERASPARDVSMTIGMFTSRNEPNVLVAGAGISATHGAASAVRTPSAKIAMGSAVGHALAYAVSIEHSDLSFIARSPQGIARLQRFLIKKGVRVVPLHGMADDPLLLTAMQLLAMDGKTALTPVWADDRLTFDASPPSDRSFFANIPPDVTTVRDALRLLDAEPNRTDIDLLRTGVSTQFITRKMLTLSLREIMESPLDTELLLKLDLLLSPES